MPGSTISVFGEPADYQAALRTDASVELMVTGRGAFQARLTRIALPRVRLLAGDESLARTARIRMDDALVRICLPVRGAKSLFWNDVRVAAGVLATQDGGQVVHERTDGPCRWRAICLPRDDLLHFGRAVAGAAFRVPAGICRLRPAAAKLQSLVRLHDTAVRANRLGHHVAADADATRGLEQQVLEALIGCLAESRLER